MNQRKSGSALTIRLTAITCLLLSFSTSGEELEEIPGLEISRSIVDGEPIYTCEATFPEDLINASSIGARLEWACKVEAFKEAEKLLGETGFYHGSMIRPVSADYHRGVLWLRITLRKSKIHRKALFENDDA